MNIEKLKISNLTQAELENRLKINEIIDYLNYNKHNLTHMCIAGSNILGTTPNKWRCVICNREHNIG